MFDSGARMRAGWIIRGLDVVEIILLAVRGAVMIALFNIVMKVIDRLEDDLRYWLSVGGGGLNVWRLNV